MFKNKVSMPVVASSGGGGGYKIKKLTITENGVYDSEFEAYKPVYVSVPQVAQGGSLKKLLDATKSANYLFNGYEGTSVDGLISYSDTANVTTMFYMFNSCSKLTSIPQLDTNNVTKMSYMCQNCTSLTSFPELDASNSTDFKDMFYYCTSLTSIGLYGFTRSIDISSTALGHDAIVAFLNQAGIAYDSSQTIIMGSAKLALLSDEEKAIATNKRWTLA